MDVSDRDSTLSDSWLPSHDGLQQIRRRLHAYPELSGDEQETARFVAAYMRGLGLDVEVGVGGHGVVGVLEGALPGPTVAYRAELDALPIRDTLDKPYASTALGVSHACGHDVHMAIALGVAACLNNARELVPGRVVFIFQPAEESLDGARAMIENGLLRHTQPEALLALHAFPLQVGRIGVALGLCLAGMEEFRVRFYAPGGNLDDVKTHAITALEALSTAHTPTTTEAIDELVKEMQCGTELDRTLFLSCWEHTSGSVPVYHLLGLVSMADFALRPSVHRMIRETLDRAVAAYGASYDLTFTFSNPPLENDAGLVSRVLPVIAGVAGREDVLEFRSPYPFAHEDLALYAKEVPTALIWLGTANSDKGIASILHTPDYDVDEEALMVGVRTMSAVLLALLTADRMLPRPPDSPPAPPDTLPAAPTSPREG